MTWSVTADPGGTAFPDLDSVLAYFDDYERAQDFPVHFEAASGCARSRRLCPGRRGTL